MLVVLLAVLNAPAASARSAYGELASVVADPWLHLAGLLVLLALVAALALSNRRLARAREDVQREVAARERLVSALPVGVYDLVDRPGGPRRVGFVSDRALELLGVSQAQIEHSFHAAFSQVHPEDIDRVVAENERAARELEPFEVVLRVVVDEQVRWLSIQSLPRSEADGTHWAGIITDITEQHQSASLIAESEQLLAAMSRLSGVGGWSLDLRSGEVQWTDQTFVIHELPVGQTPTLREALDFYHPEDREPLEQAIAAAQESGGIFDLTLRLITARGRERITRSLGQGIYRAGELVGMVGAFQDITEQSLQQQRLADAQARFRTVYEALPMTLFLHDAVTGELLDSNPAGWRNYGARSLEDLRAHADEIWAGPPYDQFTAQKQIRACAAEGLQQFDWKARRLDGSTFWEQVTLTPIRVNRRKCILAACMDITHRREAERLLRESDERFRLLLSDVPEVAVQGYGLDGSVNYWNRASEQLYGYSESEALQGNLLELIIPPEMRDTVRANLERVAAGGAIENAELELQRKDGSRVTVFSHHSIIRRQGLPTELFCLDIDLSEQKRHEEELQRIASYDPLTGLPNRSLLAEMMREFCARADRTAIGFVLCYLDLDDFKPINDQYGHEVGDRVLVQVAKRLRQIVRGSDVVARLGGDEFVLLLEGLHEGPALEQQLARLLDAVSDPIDVGELRLQIQGSLGVTQYPQDSSDPDTLLRHADQAMYRAKSQGRNSYSLFDLEFERSSQERLQRLAEMEVALTQHQFELFYHPKIDLGSGQVIGAESLIRWRHPDRGLLMPAEFLSDIEQSGLEWRLGAWVINQALKQLSEWKDKGLCLPVSVNVSGPYLLNPGFIDQLRQALEAHPEVQAEQFQLEILESAAVADLAQAIRVLDQVRALGVEISLDDFGTGYSSLSHLRSLPVDEVKIDQSFVRDMLEDHSDYSIVRSVIGLASAFELRAVAEGVETLEHARALIELGCSAAQGYAFARPMPPQVLPDWIEAWQYKAKTLLWADQGDRPD